MEPTQSSTEHPSPEEEQQTLSSPIGQDLLSENDYRPVTELLTPFATSLLGKGKDMKHHAVSERVLNEVFDLPEVARAFRLNPRSINTKAYSESISQLPPELVEEYTSRFGLAPTDLVLKDETAPNSIAQNFIQIRSNKQDYETNIALRLTVLTKSIETLQPVTFSNDNEEDDFI